MENLPLKTLRSVALATLLTCTGAVSAIASAPTDNPVATYYGTGQYPLWTDQIAWDNVIDMSTYTNGADNFEKFENARDELYAQGGGVLYYPAGTYHFDLPDPYGLGAGNGVYSRGLMLKSGVVIRGATPATGANQAVVRASDVHTDAGFFEVTYNLTPTTVFTFPFHLRGKDPISDAPNSAGEVPSHWSFIGLTTGAGEADIGEVRNIGVVNVKLEGGFIFWGYHTVRSATLGAGKWYSGDQWKGSWPTSGPVWRDRVPDGTHYMDAIHGADGWQQPISAGSGRLIFGVVSVDGAPFDDMSNMDGTRGFLPPEAFHSYRYTGRFTAHGTNIFIANNVLAKPTRNFVHKMLQGTASGGTPHTERLVLFDYANHIGVDVNKSNYGGHQNDLTVVGPDSGYHYPNTIVRDNWIFSRGNKGMDIASQYLVLLNNHNERFYAENVFPYDYITNPQAYPSATPASGINAGGISFEGWSWQSSETASDYMSRGYDIGGRNIWVHRNSVINTGSRGNDGEGIMAQRHNNIETLSWAFTNNVQNKRDLGPGTWGENGWNGIYDMHALGFLAWGNAGPGFHGIDGNIKSNYVVDVTVGPNLGTGSTSRPTSGALAPYNADYQPMHSDPVNPPTNVTGYPLPDDLGVVITWEDASNNELGFRVERRFPSDTSWQVIAYRPAQNLGAGSGLGNFYSSGIVYPEANPTRWVDYTARASMGPEYRVVAFNELDDDSTGVSDIFYADPNALKLAFVGLPGDEAFVPTNFQSPGITVTVLTEDGDGTPISFAWSQVSGPGTAEIFPEDEATAEITFSNPGIYLVQVIASDASYSVRRVLTVHAGQPISITGQPQPLSQLIGTTATFTVTVSGDFPRTYVWFKDGEVIPGATSASLVLNNIGLADAAAYTVAVTNPLGTVSSAPANLIVESAPIFLADPTDRTAAVGTTATFAVEVAAAPNPAFQWLFNGNPIPGAQGAILTISPVSLANAGAYSVQVTNIHGSATSQVATLTVVSEDRFLINWSTDDYAWDGTRVWQSFIAHTKPGSNSPPRSYENVTLVNINGDSSMGITFSQGSNVTGNNVGFLAGTSVTEALFTGDAPAWFDKTDPSQRSAFAFNQNGGYFEFTFGGFLPEDQVTFSFVLRRHSTGNRRITLVENPGAEQTVILDNVGTNLAPYYPTHSVTGSSSYTFRITSNDSNWVGMINALAVDVQYAPRPTLTPEAPVAGVIMGASGGDGHLSLPTIAGLHYQLQSSPDLVSWEDVPGANMVGNGSVMQFNGMAMPHALNPALFYRIEVTAP